MDSDRRPVYITGITDAHTSHPTFVGTATPGARIRVSANSSVLSIDAAIADENGNWRFTATRDVDIDGKVIVATQLASDFASLSDSMTYSELDTPVIDPRVGTTSGLLLVLGSASAWSAVRRRRLASTR